MSKAYSLRGPVGMAMKTLGYCRFDFRECRVVGCDEVFDFLWVPFCDAWVTGKFADKLFDSVFGDHVVVERGFRVASVHDFDVWILRVPQSLSFKFFCYYSSLLFSFFVIYPFCFRQYSLYTFFSIFTVDAPSFKIMFSADNYSISDSRTIIGYLGFIFSYVSATNYIASHLILIPPF